MPSEFCYKVYLPSTDTYEYFKELNNKELLTMLKFCANDDKVGFAEYMEYIISEKSINELTLHRLDKFCILYTMMLVCIKNTVTLVCKCEETDEDYTTVINIIDVLNVISNINYNGDTEEVHDGNNRYKIQFSRELYSAKDRLSISDVIASVTLDGDEYDITTFSKDQTDAVINRLPGGVVSRILKCIEAYNLTHNTEVYMSYKSPYAAESEQIEHRVNLLNNELFESFILMVNTDLKSFYEMSHSMAVNFSLSHDHYLNMTPAETIIYYELMKHDVDVRNAQNSSDQNNIDNIGNEV